MPAWAFVTIILVAFLACPLSMWMMSKVMRRKVSCGMCSFGTEAKKISTLAELEARRVAVEREITQVKVEIEQKVATQGVAARAEER
jgi:uncharacterized small protein (DUF1192 family)